MGNALVEDAVALQVGYPGAAAFLFDSHAGAIDGGSGRAFDWSRIPAGLVKPVILAGRLGVDHVFDAIVRTLPWGVVVSSGFQAAPGRQGGHGRRDFDEPVQHADHTPGTARDARPTPADPPNGRH